MTESEWLASDDPQRMLRHLCPRNLAECAEDGVLDDNRLASDRKLRLFAQACCDQYYTAPINENQWAYEPRMRDETFTAFNAAKLWASDVSMNPQKAALLRDIFGNPWRLVELPMEGRIACAIGGQGSEYMEPLHPGYCPWFTWNNGTVVKITQEIYDERRFEDMPILADALEEAGCAEESILRHCRGQELCHACLGTTAVHCGQHEHGGDCLVPCRSDIDNSWCSGWKPLRGPHVRGCWVVDLILGRK